MTNNDKGRFSTENSSIQWIRTLQANYDETAMKDDKFISMQEIMRNKNEWLSSNLLY